MELSNFMGCMEKNQEYREIIEGIKGRKRGGEGRKGRTEGGKIRTFALRAEDQKHRTAHFYTYVLMIFHKVLYFVKIVHKVLNFTLI